MIVLPGRIALSNFRKSKTLSTIQDGLSHIDASCISVEARYLHFASLQQDAKLIDAEHDVLVQLLDYGRGVGEPTENVTSNSLTKISVPRIGTISPWASKATDIVHLCGLEQIYRVERGIEWVFYFEQPLSKDCQQTFDDILSGLIFDPMIESLLSNRDEGHALFETATPAPLNQIDIVNGGLEALSAANQQFGFALSDNEQAYLVDQFTELGRNPTDVELMMFAQVNSEHCRHKIFNADWSIDGEAQSSSLFAMIRTTHQKNSSGTLVAYSDNAAILEGSAGKRLQPDAKSGAYHYAEEDIHFTAKVETHNHPTAISPFPGAATGAGGEIRDEGAVGRGGKPKAGLCGFSVSHLRIPGYTKKWEPKESKPNRIASPLQIMLQGPIGAAAFNNEFGRPNICGYFRSFEQTKADDENVRFGFHKPIMLAGGMGNVRPGHIHKNPIAAETPIIVLGGPTMLIGLGGGAASSVASGSSSEQLDFASVQRGNPEMQRRCQEVIDACCALGTENPIVSIHDVGAGGLCNALPELVHDAGRGGKFELRHILNDEPGMSPMQIWCNESQERYVMAINPDQLPQFAEICRRERCLFSQVGIATATQGLTLSDSFFADPGECKPIDLSMDLLFGLPPKMQRDVMSKVSPQFVMPVMEETDEQDIKAIWSDVLSFPTVADKTFLITIGDRSVTGMIVRDQMVGPWQVPVADVAVTSADYQGYKGEAMAIGERAPLAIIDAPASGRMAIGEALTNLIAAPLKDLSTIRLSANWMVAAGEPGYDADLYHTVQSVALDLCPALDIAIPVGKDSMSMQTSWQDENGEQQKSVSPNSLVITAFAGVDDIRRTLTPELKLHQGDTDLWLIDLGASQNRMGGSIYSQVNQSLGDIAPDVDAPLLKAFLQLVQHLNHQDLIFAYHDRSDGGLAATLAEMCFASRCGLSLHFDTLSGNPLGVLFNEELGAVIQTRRSDRETLNQIFLDFGLNAICHQIGNPIAGDQIKISFGETMLVNASRVDLHRSWSEVSHAMQQLRDNPACADQEFDRILDLEDPGLSAVTSFEIDTALPATITQGKRPRVAILREQGVNGQLEMAAAFDRAGFEAVDVTMSDLAAGATLEGFYGFAACGGFSFGDVLGAGEGWAKSILFNQHLRRVFSDFFHRQDTFALGVCNGCQMMSTIKQLIPGAAHWPKFVRNASEQYEARFVTVAIESDHSILFRGMKGAKVGISVAHGEGRALFDADPLAGQTKAVMRFVDNHHQPTEQYPLNPNGSQNGATGFTSDDGRFTIMMPHPERVFRSVCHSWHPDGWGEDSPWMQIFYNARKWVEQSKRN